MNHDSCDVRIFEDFDDVEATGDGAAVWDGDESHLFLIMPGQKQPQAIAVTRDQKKAQTTDRLWLLTGTREKPTLHPSLHLIGSWHGWLREGRLISC